jgi:thiamine pyrophosphokinase
MGTCYIYSGGKYKKSHLRKEDGDIVIAADKGYLYAKRDGVKPDALVGDFDSLYLLPKGVEIVRLNPIKDSTDTRDAALYAYDKGYRSFVIYDALGNRIEHQLANISLLYELKKLECEATIVDGRKTIEVLHDESVSFSGEYRGYISVFSSSETALISLKGFKYELEHEKIYSSFPLGIDNEFIGKEAEIEVLEGYITIIYNRKSI